MEVQKEIFKPIIGYDGIYEVSNLGRVKTLERPIYRKDGRLHYTQKEKILKTPIGNTGYYFISLHHPNKKTTINNIHRLVAEVFIPNPKNKRTVNHIDGNKLNNNVNNLEWATDSENIQHAYDNNLMHHNGGILATNLKTGQKYYFTKVKSLVAIGFQQSCISLCCRGKQKSHKGYAFEYIKSLR